MSKELIKKETAEKDLIEEINISGEKLKEIISTAGIKSISDNIPILKTILSVVDRVNSEVREEKLKILLSNFHSRFNTIEDFAEKMKNIFSNREGIILFQKIIYILDKGSIDEDWINLFANILQNILDSEVKEYFEDNLYILSQIERLTPQSLLILNKSEKWSRVNFTGATTMSGQTIVGDWEIQVSSFFARNININDEDIKLKIAHSFKELESSGIIYITESKTLGCTQVGARVQKLIK